MAKPKKPPTKAKSGTMTVKQTALLVGFFLELLFDAATDQLDGAASLKRILATLKQEWKGRHNEYKKQEVGYHRLEVVKGLARLYKKRGSPKKVTIEEFRHFLKYRLCVNLSENPSLITKAISLLARDKKELKIDVHHLDLDDKRNEARNIEAEEKAERYNQIIEREGVHGIAAINIEMALSLFPQNYLSQRKVGRSNFYKLSNENPEYKLSQNLDSDNRNAICKFILKDVLNFSEQATEDAMTVLWRRHLDEVLS